MSQRWMGSFWLSLCLVALLPCPASAAGITLVREGEPTATIVLAAQPTKAAQLAAYELQYHVALITGATLPVVNEGNTLTGTRILVGDSAATQALGLRNADFQLQEYLIDFRPETLVLMGHDDDDQSEAKYEDYLTFPDLWTERGTLTATYEFLEDFLGVRWFRSGEFGMDYPRETTVTVSGETRRKTPAFRHLYSYIAGSISGGTWNKAVSNWVPAEPESAFSESIIYPDLQEKYKPTSREYLAVIRRDTALFLLRRRMGGEPFSANHSFYGYYDRFWKENPKRPELWEGHRPEYFATDSLDKDGRPYQMAFHNRAFIAQVVKDAREYFETGKAYPGAMAQGDYFGVAPMDNRLYGEAPEVRAWRNDEAAKPGMFSNGVWSDYIWNFTNEVAKQLVEDYPDKYITQIAYAGMAYPPTDRVPILSPNIAIMLCVPEVVSWYNPAERENMLEMIAGWRKKAPTNPLYAWCYYNFPKFYTFRNPKAFHFFPLVNGHTWDAQIKLFHREGFRGVFMEDVPTDVDGYLVLKLWQDPTANVDDLLDEYFTRYYGHAAAPMKKIYEKMEAINADGSNYMMGVHRASSPVVAWSGLGTQPRVDELTRLFAEAEGLAQTELEKRRLAVYKHDVIDYIVQGREMYLASLGPTYNTGKRLLALRTANSPEGDPGRVDWSETTPLIGWFQSNGEPTRRRLSGQIATDGRFFYLQLTERTPSVPTSTEDFTSGDCWQVLFAQKPGAEYGALLVNPEGKFRSYTRGGVGITPAGGQPWDCGATVTSTTTDGKWVTRLALPLARLLSPDSPAGATFLLNVQRRSGTSDDQPMWISTHDGFEATTNLGTITLDEGAALAGLDPHLKPTERVSEGLVGWWQFKEGKGSEIADSSGYNAAGRIIGRNPLWVEGRKGPALDLEARVWVDFGAEPQFDLDQGLTLEIWFKPTASPIAYPGLLSRGGPGDVHRYTLGFSKLNDSLSLRVDDAGGQHLHYNPQNVSPIPGQWNHAVATYDGQTMRLYLNGRELGSGRAAQIRLTQTPGPLLLGICTTQPPAPGIVDEAAVYERALTREEVWQNYRYGKPE